MRFSPMLAFHICSGVLGFLAGSVAIVFRKGSRRHAVAGNLFVVSMLSLSASRVYLAAVTSEPETVLVGTLTFYLVATAWMTAKRRNGETGLLDWAALSSALAVGAFIAVYALEALRSPIGLSHGYSIGPYIFLGSVTLIAAAGDIRMLAYGDMVGARRVARHLWRMCFAFFIASAPIILARQQIFPAILRKTGAVLVLSLLPLILMIFWLVRVRVSKAFRAEWTAPRSGARSLPT
jgi:hypothetical protein